MIDIELDKSDLRLLKELSHKFHLRFEDAIRAIADEAVAQAKQQAPHSEGTLRRSISAEIKTTFSSVEAWVGANVPYAFYQEFGFKRHFVPFSVAPSLLRWAKRQGMKDLNERAGLWVKKDYRLEEGYYLIPGINAAIRQAEEKVGREIDKL